jgi:hypothetical protein
MLASWGEGYDVVEALWTALLDYSRQMRSAKIQVMTHPRVYDCLRKDFECFRRQTVCSSRLPGVSLRGMTAVQDCFAATLHPKLQLTALQKARGVEPPLVQI